MPRVGEQTWHVWAYTPSNKKYRVNLKNQKLEELPLPTVDVEDDFGAY